MGDFFVHIEGGFRFVVATKDFGQFHQNSEAVAILFFAEKVQLLLVEVGGIFSFIQVSIDIGRALQDDFIFRKIFRELVDCVAGFGD